MDYLEYMRRRIESRTPVTAFDFSDDMAMRWAVAEIERLRAQVVSLESQAEHLQGQLYASEGLAGAREKE